MELKELVTTVCESKATDWHRVPPPVGPQYLAEISSPEGYWLEVHEHYGYFTYQPDVQIGFAFGMTTSQDDEILIQGMPPFIDSVIRGLYGDILFNGVPVYREYFMSVDGGRAILPLPNHEAVTTEAPPGTEQIANSVTQNHEKLARLINLLQGGGEFEKYFERSEITTIPDSSQPPPP